MTIGPQKEMRGEERREETCEGKIDEGWRGRGRGRCEGESVEREVSARSREEGGYAGRRSERGRGEREQVKGRR